jgi:hypothetical protein
MIQKINKWLPIATLAIVIILFGLVGGNNQSVQSFGAAVANRLPHGYWDTAEGYYVDGVAVINASGNTLTLGTVDVLGVEQSFTSATTTPCSIQNPFSATSTLMSYMFNITTGTSTGAVMDVGIANTAFATTTIQNGGITVASGAQATHSATTSITVGANQWVVLKTGVGVGGFTYGGTCHGLFVQP